MKKIQHINFEVVGDLCLVFTSKCKKLAYMHIGIFALSTKRKKHILQN